MDKTDGWIPKRRHFVEVNKDDVFSFLVTCIEESWRGPIAGTHQKMSAWSRWQRRQDLRAGHDLWGLACGCPTSLADGGSGGSRKRHSCEMGERATPNAIGQQHTIIFNPCGVPRVG